MMEKKINATRNTLRLNDEVEKCETLAELQQILNQNSEYYQEWKRYINLLMERKHANYVQMARLCHSSKNTVKKWCREGAIPQNREAFFKIALGFRLNLEETNHLLQRYGKYPRLYAKSMEDAVCIFVIQHYPEDGDAYEYYLQLKERLLKILQRKEGKNANADRDTNSMEEGVLSQKTMEEFEDFVIENRSAFLKSFEKLAEFIDLFIETRNDNIHNFVKSSELDFSYEKMLSMLKTKGECPNRMKLILLGVHLNMSLENINYMLSLAYMEPMCAKDNVECVVMYAVTNAYLNNPAYELESAMVLQYYERSPELQKKCYEIVKAWDAYAATTESQEDMHFMEESIGEYLRYIFEQLDWQDEQIYRLL